MRVPAQILRIQKTGFILIISPPFSYNMHSVQSWQFRQQRLPLRCHGGCWLSPKDSRMLSIRTLSQANERRLTLLVKIMRIFECLLLSLTSLFFFFLNEWLRKWSRILLKVFFNIVLEHNSIFIEFIFLIRNLSIRKNYHMNHKKMRLEVIFHGYADYVTTRKKYQHITQVQIQHKMCLNFICI